MYATESGQTRSILYAGCQGTVEWCTDVQQRVIVGPGACSIHECTRDFWSDQETQGGQSIVECICVHKIVEICCGRTRSCRWSEHSGG